MMGCKARDFRPVSAVSLEELVPADHFYRHLERVLDLGFVRDLVHDCYAAGGRPSIDPVVFFKLQLVMFFEDVRSERLLMRLVADRLSVRWYLGYNLDDPLPDHSSLTRIRLRYGLAIFRRFFEAMVEQCQQAGLVWGRELYFDATQVQANAALDSLTPRFAVEARAALHAHLAHLFPEQPAPPEQEPQDPANSARVPSPCAAAEAAPADGAAERASPPLASAQTPLPDPPPAPPPVRLPVDLPEALREELATANRTRHDWLAEAGRQQRAVTHGGYQRTADFRVSRTDPDATPMRLKGGGVRLGYHTHYVVDGGKRRIILGVLVTPSEVMENQPMLDLLWQARFRWRLWPRQATGDTTYGTIENITALEREGIRAYMPLPDFDHRTPFYGKERFQYDAERDVYRCPQGATLQPVGISQLQQTVRYKAPPSVCRACPCRAECTTNPAGRVIVRQFEEAALERVRAAHQTKAYQKAMRKRQVWVEPLFGEGKQWHGMRRFRLRQLWRVNTEALLIAGGQNLKRLLQQRGWGRRPFPSGAAATGSGFSIFSRWLVLGTIEDTAGGFRDRSPILATQQIQLAA